MNIRNEMDKVRTDSEHVGDLCRENKGGAKADDTISDTRDFVRILWSRGFHLEVTPEVNWTSEQTCSDIWLQTLFCDI